MENYKSLDSPLRYTVGWIAPLAIERAAAEALLDEKHGEPRNFSQPCNDRLSYSWGSIGKHNVVIASLKAGMYGTNSAATAATSMLSTFPSIRFGLLVGIGGAIPRTDGTDIRLGDVVISEPSGSTGGVIQYDLVKLSHGHRERKDFLNAPLDVLLYALSNLKAQYEQRPSKVPSILAEMESRNPYMFQPRPNNPGFRHQGLENDRLFNANYEHAPGRDCKNCLREEEVEREARGTTEPVFHFGVIASGNTLVKDAAGREELLNHIPDECICYEMEAAGLMNSFPCLVIRGSSDYSDSHKNDRWQRYAAATAAAFGKELLGVIPEKDVEIADAAIDVIEKFAHQITKIRDLVEDANQHSKETTLRNWLCPPNPSVNHAKAFEKRYKNTCQWFLNDTQFEQWKSKAHAFLWVYGIAGCGKTILSLAIIEKLREDFTRDSTSVVVYFYFDFNNKEKRNLAGMVCSLVHQLQISDAEIRENLLRAQYRFGGERPNLDILNDSLKQTARQVKNIYVVLDGLDEVDGIERLKICNWMKDMIRGSNNNLRILVTSRSEQDIEVELRNIDMTYQILRKVTQVDIQAYVEDAVQNDSRLRRWSSCPAIQQRISKTLTEEADGMFQWVSCQLDSLKDCLDYQALETALLSLPVSLENLYGQILSRIPKPQKQNALRLLQLLAYSSRPLRAKEAIDALATDVSVRPAFDPANRLPDANEITRYCSSLIAVDPVEYYDLAPIPEDLKSKSDLFGHDHTQLVASRELKLVHKSVRDYITSDVADGVIQQHLQESIAKAEIAKVSLCYLLSLPCNLPVWEINRRLPFALWASTQWWEFAHVAEKNESTRATIAEFLSSSATYQMWRLLYSPETFKEMASEVAHMQYLQRRKSESKPEEVRAVVPALLTATIRGLSRSIEKLAATPGISLEHRETWNPSPYDFCPSGFERLTNGKFATPTALYKASQLGNSEMVKYLLKSGARAHLIGGVYGSPLSIACLNSHEQVVHLLLDRIGEGCEISMKLALLHTISNRHTSILQLFIKNQPASLFHLLEISIPSTVRYEQGVKVPYDRLPGEDFNWLVSQVLDHLTDPRDAEVPYRHVQLVVEGFKAALKFSRHAAIREIVQRLQNYWYDGTTRAMAFSSMLQYPFVKLAFEASRVDALTIIYKFYEPSWEIPSWDSGGTTSDICERDFRFLIASSYHPAESDMESGVWKLQDRILAFRCRGSSKTAFHLAAEHGDPKLIKALLQATGELQISLNTRDRNGNTPLTLAAAKGKLATTMVLRQAGVDYESNCFGLTPIAAAAENGHRDVANPPELHLREKMGCAENDECSSTKSEHLFPEASRRKAQEYTFAQGLTESVLANDSAKVREALEMPPMEYFEGEFQSLLARTIQPVLHLAAANGNLEIAGLLIQTGADVNWPLEVKHVLACEKSSDEKFSKENHHYLPDSLVKLVKGNQEGLGLELMVRPLHLAINHCSPDVVQLLVCSGADMNVISYTLHPPPPLHFAAENSSWEILRILLGENEEISRRDRCGATAIHYAAISGSIENIKGLVREGFSPYEKDYDGWTPLDWHNKVRSVRGREDALITDFLASEGWMSRSPTRTRTPTPTSAHLGERIQMILYSKLRMLQGQD